MNTPAYVTRLILPALAIALASAAARLPAAPAPDKVFLAPHRAVYDLKLSKSHGGRSIEAVRGRILYDFSGNACDGYELQFRQVSELNSGEGKSAVSDLRSTTWEDAAAKKFRFNSENLLNEQQTDAVDGHAERDADGGRGQLEQAEGEDIHRAGQCRVPDRAYAPHHYRGARGKKHSGVSGL